MDKKNVLFTAQLAPADKEELSYSHPGQPVEKLLAQFRCLSSRSFVFSYRGAIGAMGGVTPQGCVWMLTAPCLRACPKTFVKAARKWLGVQLRRYPVLFNWVDEHHHTARRFITYLGGVFTGEYQVLSGRKFLFFTFRRDCMGGIIQAGRMYTSTAAQALSQTKRNKQYFSQRADATRENRRQTWLHNRAQTEYLFRSAAEKNHLLQEQARQQAATLQNTLAHKGLDGSSVTVQLLLEKEKLAAAQKQEKIAREVSAQVNAADEKTAQTIAALRTQEAAARKKANQKSTVWKMTKQLFSWFK